MTQVTRAAESREPQVDGLSVAMRHVTETRAIRLHATETRARAGSTAGKNKNGREKTSQTTLGGAPVSLTIGLPASSQAPIPPPTFTASKPFWFSHAATRAERPPPRHVT